MNYRWADAVLLLYDISSRYSFDSVKGNWSIEAKQYMNDNSLLVVIGNKCDLPDTNHSNNQQQIVRQVAYEEGEALCRELGAQFFMECSSKTGENVENIVIRLVETLIDRPCDPTRNIGSQSKQIQHSGCISSWLSYPLESDQLSE